MAVVGVELETLVSELDALTIRPPQIMTRSFSSIKLDYIENELYFFSDKY